MADIRHFVNIKAPAKKIYEAVSTKNGLKSWWTDKVTGGEKEGETIQFHFGPDYHKDMAIKKIVPGKRVEWACTVGHPEWVGTKLSFDIEDKGDKSILRFAHDGWREETDLYGQCSYDWAGFIRSLKNMAESGEGMPYKN